MSNLHGRWNVYLDCTPVTRTCSDGETFTATLAQVDSAGWVTYFAADSSTNSYLMPGELDDHARAVVKAARAILAEAARA